MVILLVLLPDQLQLPAQHPAQILALLVVLPVVFLATPTTEAV